MAEKVIIKNAKASVTDNPIILFIEGDGTGPDIWAASKKVLDSAIEIAYKKQRKIEWKEVFKVVWGNRAKKVLKEKGKVREERVPYPEASHIVQSLKRK